MSMSVAAILAESATRRPDHTAVIDGSRALSYQALWRHARQYASALAGEGIGQGDRVALLIGNQAEFPMAYFGVLALGAAVVPVNTLLKAHEIAYVLRDAGCVALVCAVSLLPEGQRAADMAHVRLLTLGADVTTAQTGLAERAERAEPIGSYIPRDPEDLALVLYTSGTTGHPKGAMLTHLNITMNVHVGMLSPFDFRPDDVLLGCLPLFHTFGQICGMATCFRAGATIVLMERFVAPQALELMTERRCTVLMGVPTMYIALLEAAAAAPRKPTLDRAFCGGSALPVSVLSEFTDVFGCQIYEGYGLTETSPVVAYNQKYWPCRPGTVGRPIWGVEAEIARADLEDRVELLPPDQVGEIVIRGHNVMAGYLNQPAATAEVMVDGWFRSGDLGVKDKDGYLSIVDRKKDMVLRNGYNVYPREVEETLMRHPAIAQVAVIGLPDPVRGEEVCAVVRLRPGSLPGTALEAEIIAWSRERLAAYKYPRQVEFVDDFPLGPSGKILKRDLAARLHG